MFPKIEIKTRKFLKNSTKENNRSENAYTYNHVERENKERKRTSACTGTELAASVFEANVRILP